MANNDVQHDVKFIFMLGFLGGHDDPNAETNMLNYFRYW